jgi:TadE-like protein
MRLARFCRDERGTTVLEFALTVPIFFSLLFGIIGSGLLLWMQLGLQHGAEMAARCASVNANICGSVSSIQSYAASEAYGLNPSPSVFSVTTPACGNRVSASYTFQFITSYVGMPSLTLSAQSCFPI